MSCMLKKLKYIAGILGIVFSLNLGHADVTQRLQVSTQDGTLRTFPNNLKVTNGTLINNNDGSVNLNVAGTAYQGFVLTDSNNNLWNVTVDISGRLVSSGTLSIFSGYLHPNRIVLKDNLGAYQTVSIDLTGHLITTAGGSYDSAIPLLILSDPNSVSWIVSVDNIGHLITNDGTTQNVQGNGINAVLNQATHQVGAILNIDSGTIAILNSSAINDSGLTTGSCVQAGVGGALVTLGPACGTGSGGSSSTTVQLNGTNLSANTTNFNFVSGFGTIITGSTPTVNNVTLTVLVDTTTAILSQSSATTTYAYNNIYASIISTGLLKASDWNTFNAKGNGTVTSVSGGTAITSTGGATPSLSLSQTIPQAETVTSSLTVVSTMTALSVVTNGSGAGQWQSTEGTPPTGISVVDLTYANSTDHSMHLNNNNGVDARIAQIIIGSLATIQAATTFIGEIGVCTSGCTTDFLCVSTSTIHSFVRTSAQTTACQ